jgi:hypothetical protein
MTTARDGGRFSALRTGRLYPRGNTPGTHFCYRVSRPQGHSAIGRILYHWKTHWHHLGSNQRPSDYFWKFKKLKYFSVPSSTGFSVVVCIPLSTNYQICRSNSPPFVQSYFEIGNTYIAVQLCFCLNTIFIHLFMHTVSSNTKDTGVFTRSGSKTNSNWINNQFTMRYIWDIVNVSCNNKFL